MIGAIKKTLNPVLRLAFRTTNSILNRFGILISRPEAIHGSPAFSGATLQSRKIFGLKNFMIWLRMWKGMLSKLAYIGDIGYSHICCLPKSHIKEENFHF